MSVHGDVNVKFPLMIMRDNIYLKENLLQYVWPEEEKNRQNFRIISKISAVSEWFLKM